MQEPQVDTRQLLDFFEDLELLLFDDFELLLLDFFFDDFELLLDLDLLDLDPLLLDFLLDLLLFRSRMGIVSSIFLAQLLSFSLFTYTSMR